MVLCLVEHFHKENNLKCTKKIELDHELKRYNNNNNKLIFFGKHNLQYLF